MGKTKIVDLLDRLEETIETARRVPLLNRVLADRYEMLELLDQIRIALPEEVKHAEAVLAEKDRILTEAAAEAERLRASAKEHLGALVSQEEVVKAAEAEAARIIAEARAQASEIRSGADEYAAQTLLKMEESLQKTLKVVRRGVEELKRKG
ncbi:MAG: ATPase [Firmicutes bacterium]|nr:ATPase [Bacillota bacterium]MDH7494893.1 ATPase [Bacillota bacterium]